MDPERTILNEATDPSLFESRHWLVSHTGDGRDLVMMSGNAKLNFKGTSDGRRVLTSIVFWINNPHKIGQIGDPERR